MCLFLYFQLFTNNSLELSNTIITCLLIVQRKDFDFRKYIKKKDKRKRKAHYENTPFQIYRKFHVQNGKCSDKNSDVFFYISAQNIDCGYSLEPPRRGCSNEYQILIGTVSRRRF